MTIDKTAFVITNPMIAENNSSSVTTSKFIRVISPLYDELEVVGGSLRLDPDVKATIASFPIIRAKSRIKRLVNLIKVQKKAADYIKKNARSGQTVFFWLGDKMLLPFRAALKKKMKTYYFIYGNTADEGGGLSARLSSKLIEYMANRASYVCAESPSVLTEWDGIRNENVKILHLYAEPSAEPSFIGREKIIGMCCRIAEGKRVPESIRAFCAVHTEHPEWKLEIVGSGRLQTRCAELTESLGAAEYVKMYGWIEHDELPVITDRWKFLLYPTDTEGLPNGVLELMGRGIPAAVSPRGGLKDLIKPGENGVFLEGSTEQALGKALTELTALPESEYLTMSRNAYDTVKSEYTLENATALAAREL